MEHDHGHRGLHGGPGDAPAGAGPLRRAARHVPRREAGRVHDHRARRREVARREPLRQPDHVHARRPRDAGVRRRPEDGLAHRGVRRCPRRQDPHHARPPDHDRPGQPRPGAREAERAVHHPRGADVRRRLAGRRRPRPGLAHRGGPDHPVPPPNVPDVPDRGAGHQPRPARQLRRGEPGRVRGDPAAGPRTGLAAGTGQRDREDAHGPALDRGPGVARPPARTADEPRAGDPGPAPQRPGALDDASVRAADAAQLRSWWRRPALAVLPRRADRPAARLRRPGRRELVRAPLGGTTGPRVGSPGPGPDDGVGHAVLDGRRPARRRRAPCADHDRPPRPPGRRGRPALGADEDRDHEREGAAARGRRPAGARRDRAEQQRAGAGAVPRDHGIPVPGHGARRCGSSPRASGTASAT